MRSELSILPLRLNEICYGVGKTSLLSNITLTIPAGRTLAVVGPNGAGKSLLLRLCHGLIKPTRGHLTWNVEPNMQRRHAMVFQYPVLLRRSVRANIDYALGLARVSRVTARERADHAIEKFGLGDITTAPARLLSGGEQQRLAIARAWVLQPQVLFLDEPTAHLDPGATRIVERLLADFRAEGITIVFSTHELAQVHRLADDVVLLHRGRLIESGPAAPFLSEPQTKTAASYLAGELLW